MSKHTMTSAEEDEESEDNDCLVQEMPIKQIQAKNAEKRSHNKEWKDRSKKKRKLSSRQNNDK